MRMSAIAGTSADQMPAGEHEDASAPRRCSAGRERELPAPLRRARPVTPSRGEPRRVAAGGAGERRADEPGIGVALARAPAGGEHESARYGANRRSLRAGDHGDVEAVAALERRACAPARRSPPASRRASVRRAGHLEPLAELVLERRPGPHGLEVQRERERGLLARAASSPCSTIRYSSWKCRLPAFWPEACRFSWSFSLEQDAGRRRGRGARRSRSRAGRRR